jgi:thiaminase/transcriptional activator TenA
MRGPQRTPIAFVDEYAAVPYQEVAAKARAHLDRLADLYATSAREAELIAIFGEATRLEADFWEMGRRAAQRVEEALEAPKRSAPT